MEMFYPSTNKNQTSSSKILFRYDCKKNLSFENPSVNSTSYLNSTNDHGTKIVNIAVKANESEQVRKTFLNKEKEIRIINLSGTKLEPQIHEKNIENFPIFEWNRNHKTNILPATKSNMKCINTRRKSLESNISNFSSLSSNSKLVLGDAPLSPQSVKKFELCSYLKLRNLNSSDTKNNTSNKSRRSSRVKNLQILSEKRELEKKLNAKPEMKHCDPCVVNETITNMEEPSLYPINLGDVSNPAFLAADSTETYNINSLKLNKKYTIMTINKNNKINKSSGFNPKISTNPGTEKTLVENSFPEGPELTASSFKELQLRFNEKLTSLNFIEACSKMFHPRTIPRSLLKRRINFEDSIKDIIVHCDKIKKRKEMLSKYKSSNKCGPKAKKTKIKKKLYIQSGNCIKTRLRIFHSMSKRRRPFNGLTSCNNIKKPINRLLKKKTNIKRQKSDRIKKKNKCLLTKNVKKESKKHLVTDNKSTCFLSQEKLEVYDKPSANGKTKDKNCHGASLPVNAIKEHDYDVTHTNVMKVRNRTCENELSENPKMSHKMDTVDTFNKLKQKCVIQIKPLKVTNIDCKLKQVITNEVNSNFLKDKVHKEVPIVTGLVKENVISSEGVSEKNLLSSETNDFSFKGFLKCDSYHQAPNAFIGGLDLKQKLSSFLSKNKGVCNINVKKCHFNKDENHVPKGKPLKETPSKPLICSSDCSPVDKLLTPLFTSGKATQHNGEQDVSSTTDFQKDSQMITVRKLAIKTLHRNLIQSKNYTNKVFSVNQKNNIDTLPTSSSNEKIKQHTIHISKENGSLISCQYYNFNLVVVQETIISIWTQSPLGSLLEAQNMWIPRGSIHRLKPDNGALLAVCKENITYTENSIASVELWTKEHVSDKRESPLADVFAVIYFWRSGQSGLDKKFLQLETINGFAEDVRCVILRNTPNILVTWRTIRDDTPYSLIHCYQLANDYRTIASIKEMSPVHHGISSLHNVEDTETVIMGCGDHNVTLWNLEYGYIVATIKIEDNLPEPSCLWAKCDRGFLFIVQNHLDAVIKLIAINGINHSWKRLQVFKTPTGYKKLQGISIDNGVLVSFFDNGILCWNVESAELIAEELSTIETYFPSGKFIITYNSKQELKVKNSISYIMKNYDCMDL